MLLVVLPGLLAGRAGRLAGQGGEAVSAAVAKFVRSQRLPKPQTPRLLLAVRDERVEIFSVSYGEPQDCMVGCFYSWLSGLRFAGKLDLGPARGNTSFACPHVHRLWEGDLPPMANDTSRRAAIAARRGSRMLFDSGAAGRLT